MLVMKRACAKPSRYQSVQYSVLILNASKLHRCFVRQVSNVLGFSEREGKVLSHLMMPCRCERPIMAWPPPGHWPLFTLPTRCMGLGIVRSIGRVYSLSPLL